MNRTIMPLTADSECLIIHDVNQRIECSLVSTLLDLAVSTTQSDAAHFYWMDSAGYELRLVGASSISEDSRIPRVSLRFPSTAKTWLTSVAEPVLLTPGDPKYNLFPEILAIHLSGLLIFPLREEKEIAGVLTLSRRARRNLSDAEIAIVPKLASALSEAMKDFDQRQEVEQLCERLRSARHENAILERRLVERKLVERAKGLLQVQFGWTEEEAYYHLRRTSRQHRMPMASIAQRIIDVSTTPDTEPERLSA